MSAPDCPYCKRPTQRQTGRFVFPRRPELAHRLFFVCSTCDARVGCHERTGRPLGTPANAELRLLRKRCHDTFDPLWVRAAPHLRPTARTGAYVWLAAELGVDRLHFGEVDEVQARQVLAFLTFLDTKPAVALLVTLGEDAQQDFDELDDFCLVDPWETP